MLTNKGNGDAPFRVATDHAPGAVPSSRLFLSPTIRGGGFLSAIPPEELKTLIVLLTFLTSNGHVLATSHQVAEAMGCPERRARERLNRLAAIEWAGEPIIIETRRESGLDTYAPSRNVVQATVADTPSSEHSPALTAVPASEVVSESRRRYAHTRSEVEGEIATRNGWELPDGFPMPEGHAGAAYLAARLSKIGVPDAEARILLAAYPPERIFRQCQWLSQRSAKSPAKFLVAAVEGDYDAPRRWGMPPADPAEASMPGNE